MTRCKHCGEAIFSHYRLPVLDKKGFSTGFYSSWSWAYREKPYPYPAYMVCNPDWVDCDPIPHEPDFELAIQELFEIVESLA